MDDGIHTLIWEWDATKSILYALSFSFHFLFRFFLSFSSSSLWVYVCILRKYLRKSFFDFHLDVRLEREVKTKEKEEEIEYRSKTRKHLQFMIIWLEYLNLDLISSQQVSPPSVEKIIAYWIQMGWLITLLGEFSRSERIQMGGQSYQLFRGISFFFSLFVFLLHISIHYNISFWI